MKAQKHRSVSLWLLVALSVAFCLHAQVGATTRTVSNLNDHGPGSLRDTIAASTSGDIIEFSVNGTITLLSGELQVNKNLTIAGPGSDFLIISGNNLSRIFNVTNVTASISGLTLANGKTTVTTDYYSGRGGAILTFAVLAISNCVFFSNSAAVANNDGAGGAIFNSFGRLTIRNSQVVSNTADVGGGIMSWGSLMVNNCTFTGNSAVQAAGAIEVAFANACICDSTFNENSAASTGAIAVYDSSSVVGITNCTIVNNHADLGSGGLYINSGTLTICDSTIFGNSTTRNRGGGIDKSGGTVTLRSTIVAGNSAPEGPDLFGSFVSDSFNLIGITNGSIGFGLFGSHDQVGSAASPINPMLGSLQNNGGTTHTVAPLPRSLVIDQGHSSGVAFDQRGRPRPYNNPAIANPAGGDGSDIGAVELSPVTVLVTTTSDGGLGSLRQALLDATDSDGDTITFASNVVDAVTLITGPLAIENKIVTITGPGAKVLSVSGNDANTVFSIRNSEVTISGMTITHGLGGILNYHSTLRLNECIISSNSGAGLINQGILAANHCSLVGNTSGFGGGLRNGTGREAALTNTTVSGNFGERGGGIHNDGSLQLVNCTIADNDALTGGGVFNYPDEEIEVSTFSFSSIIAGNRAGNFPDVAGLFISTSYSLIGKNDGSDGLADGMNQNQVGSVARPLLSFLAPLADYGGPTLSQALLIGSPALDRGQSNGIRRDQRGALRPYDFGSVLNGTGGDGSDIGAVEWNPPVLNIARSAGQALVSWPESERLYRLEAASSLGGTIVWSLVGAPVATINGFNTVRENFTPNQKFYRLAVTNLDFIPTTVLRSQDFEVNTAVNYTLSQLVAPPPPAVQNAVSGSSGRFLRLLHDGVNDDVNAIAFDQTAPGLWRTIQTEFDFRLTSLDSPADGFAFMLIPTSVYGATGSGYISPGAFEEPNIPGVFAIGFDVFPHAASDFINDVSVHWNGAENMNSRINLSSVDLASGNFHHCKVILTHVPGGAIVAVSITPNINLGPGTTIRPILAFVPGLNPFDSRVEFAGRTGGLNMSVDLDDINVLFTTGRVDY